MTDLKPCPFCGGEARIHFSVWGDSYYAKCCKCLAETKVHQTEAEAIEAWNRRASDAE